MISSLVMIHKMNQPDKSPVRQTAEPHWPVLDTSGAEQAARTISDSGWARRADLADTVSEGLPDPDVMKFDFELDPFQKQVQGGVAGAAGAAVAGLTCPLIFNGECIGVMCIYCYCTNMDGWMVEGTGNCSV